MASSDKIMCIIESLMSESITTEGKLKLYSAIKEFLDSFYKEEVVVLNEEDSLRYLFTCIQLDLKSDSVDVQYEGLLILKKFFTFEWKAPLVKEVIKDFSNLAFAKTSTADLREAALSCVKMCLRELVLHDICNPEEILADIDTDDGRQIVVDLLLELRQTETILSKHWPNLLYDVVVTQMFSSKTTEIRKYLILIGFKLLEYFPINVLPYNKLEKFKIKVKVLYIGQIGELRLSKDPSWHHLCQFLCMCLGKLLHNPSDISIVNSLLRHLEAAFRSHIDDKVCAYICWRALIDNYSLDRERMMTSKQINLLLTPLKTNLSKDERVILKRYEAWAHLLNILKEHSIICLIPWLEFCFGPLEMNPFEADHDTSIRSCGRKVVTLTETSALSLYEILGHYRHDKNDCVFNLENSLVQLDLPVITSNNFDKFGLSAISAVGECTYLLLQWMDKNKIPKAVTCLWGSLMKIISELDYSPDKEIGRAMSYITALMEKSWENEEYGQYLVVPILELFVSNQFISVDLFYKLILFPLIKAYLHSNNTFLHRGREAVFALLKNNKPSENKAKWLEQMNNALSTNLSVKSDYALEMWLEVSDVLIAVYKESNESEYMTIVENFLMWPLNFINLVQANDLKSFNSAWSSKLIELYKIDTKIIDVFKSIEKSHTNTPILLNNAVLLFAGSQWIFTINSAELCAALLNLLYEILSNPYLNESNIELLHKYVREFGSMYSSNQFYKEQKIDILYKILEDLCNKRVFETIHTVKILFDKCPKFREHFPPTLQKCIIEMRKNDNIEISRVANGLQAKFLALQKTNVITPISKFFKTPFESTNKVSPPTHFLSLFGRSTIRTGESPSTKIDQEKPKKVEIPTRKSKRRNSFLIDEDAANYVLVDSNYTFNPETLTTHQIEVLKRPRTDIPALYHDLTVSQSSSLTSFEEFQKANPIETDSIMVKKTSPSTSQNVEHFKSRYSLKNDAVKLPSPLPSYSDVFKSDIVKDDKTITNLVKSRPKIKSKKYSDSFTAAEPTEIQKTVNESEEEATDLEEIIRNDKVQKELAKIKMDIVGGDLFLRNLSLTDRVRTRRSVDVTDLKRDSEKVAKKPKDLDSNVNEETKEKSCQNSNSEDVIESSQDSLMEPITCQKTVEKTSAKKGDTEVVSSESIFSDNRLEALPSQNSETLTTIESVNNRDLESKETQPVQDSPKSDVTQMVACEVLEETQCLRVISNKSIEDSEQCDEIGLQNVTVGSPDELINRDIASNTLCQMNTAEMNTESLDINLSTPQKPRSIDIPTSPIQVDTPTRTTELLRNTSDISPIKSLLQFDFNMEEKIQKTQQMLGCDIKSFTTHSSLNSSKDVAKDTVKNSKSGIVLNGKVLHYVVPKSLPKFELKNKMYTKLYGESRIMRMMKNCGEELKNYESVSHENSKEKTDYLQYDKPLPSPLASPKVSILKRKTPETREEDLSPPRKVQKKVNFSDPPTTCKKLYVQYDNEDVSYISNEIENTKSSCTPEIPIVSQPQNQTAITEGSSTNKEETVTTPPVQLDLTPCLKADEVITVRKALLSLSEKLRRNSVDSTPEVIEVDGVEKSKSNSNNEIVSSQTNLSVSQIVEKPIVKRKRISLITISSPKKSHKSTNSIVGNATISSPKQSHTSTNSIVGNATNSGDVLNENSSLENAILEVGTQIERIKAIAARKNLNSSTLFRDTVDKIGNSECISILQDNKSLSINNLVKNDDWSLIISDILKLIGLNRLVSTLNSLNSDFVKSIYHTLPEDKSQELIKIGLQNLQLEKTVDILHGYFSKKHILNTVVLQLNPSLTDAVSCFQYINFVELNGDTVIRSKEEDEDFDKFVDKIIKVADKSTVSKLVTTHKSLIPISELKASINSLPLQELKKLVFPLLDQIPHAEVFKYLYQRLSKAPEGQ